MNKRKLVDYLIATGLTPSELSRTIVKYSNDGYELAGSLITISLEVSGDVLAQAMALYENVHVPGGSIGVNPIGGSYGICGGTNETQND